MSDEYLLRMKSVSKSFPGVQALKDVDFAVRRGTVHALMGENGAGKSTLMKILYGVYRPDAGEVIFKAKPHTAKNPTDAIRMGLAMIPQEINPVRNLSVASNVFLGREATTRFGLLFVNQKKIEADTRHLFEALRISMDPRLKMSELSIANAQLVAIATAVSYNADLIIMDEPTSALTEREVEHLHSIVRSLRDDKGISTIYISHKLDEVFDVADEVTVLRDGQHMGTDAIGNFTKDRLISMMVGRSFSDFFHKESATVGEVVLSVRNLSKKNKFKDISFDARRGEVLALSGLMGSGRTEVMEALFGMRRADSGEIWIKGEKVQIRSPKDAIRHGMGFVTEDRKFTGLFPELSIRDNIIMPDIGSYIRVGFLNLKEISRATNNQATSLSIRTPSVDQLIKNLSGGNQQKVLIARWLLMKPEILILDEPTRGIDVGAKAEIHRLISELAKSGKAIIMVSSEMPEVLSMSDRIVVMHEGTYSGTLLRTEATQEKLLELATGETATT